MMLAADQVNRSRVVLGGKFMPELRCPECGKEFLPGKTEPSSGTCMCTACGRDVYPGETTTVKVSCPKCGKKAETTVIS